jgi:transcriptional regulator with XRE-family HTH domain
VTDDAYTAERDRLLQAFGERLRAARELRDVSQETLAKVARVHRTHIGAMEAGRREPHLTMLLILADALHADNLLAGLPVPVQRKPPTHWKGGS